MGTGIGLLLACVLFPGEIWRDKVALGASASEPYFIQIEDCARRLVNAMVVLPTDPGHVRGDLRDSGKLSKATGLVHQHAAPFVHVSTWQIEATHESYHE